MGTPLKTLSCIRALSDGFVKLSEDVESLCPNDQPVPAATTTRPYSGASSLSLDIDVMPSSALTDPQKHNAGQSSAWPELTLESVLSFISSPQYHLAGGVPRQEVLRHVSGTGLAPWEIHRPQRFVRDLVLRRCFSGRVLDAGCGIGDNALYVAKACPAAQVVAVDVVPRCLEFASAKAGLRGMRGRVALEVADLLEQDPARLPEQLGPGREGSFSAVLDSSTFHCFPDAERELYVSNLRRLLKPGGLIYMNCMSEEETRPGGPRRISVSDVHSVFSAAAGWRVEGVEDSTIEFHPSFWGGGIARARLFTVRRL